MTAFDLVVTCTTDTIAAGNAETHEIVILVKGKSSEVQNIASVSSETDDPSLANNEVEHVMSLKPGS